MISIEAEDVGWIESFERISKENNYKPINLGYIIYDILKLVIILVVNLSLY
jgi:hypothetical protein